MNRTSCWIGAILLFLWAGCSSGTDIEPGPGDVGQQVDPGMPTDMATDQEPTAVDVVTDLSDDSLSEPDADPGCDPGTGCFGDPCQSNADCVSGFCLLHEGDRICSKPCIEDCPQGWSCQPVDTGGTDLSFACVSDFSHLCQPCMSKEDCSAGSVQNVCVNYGEVGKFCGASCANGGLCPEGYICEDIASVSGGVSAQCINADGVCDCGQTATDLALSTECSLSNEAGTCTGIRTCTPEGLSACDALEPAVEVCNGVDDNCDGSIDESTCDDANPCTTDVCQGEAGCQYTVLIDIPCDDGTACTVGETCTDGECVGEDVHCDNGNPCTDDICDPTVGCVYTPNDLDCDDYNDCTLGDICSDGDCVPGLEISCNDGNPCTDDSCTDTGCAFSANTEDCDDGNPCTPLDICYSGVCQGLGIPNCDDGNDCTTDVCDAGSGCIANNNNLPCTDGNICTLNDACGDGACQPGTTTLICDDGNPCTDDSCHPLSGCIFTHNTAACDDGNACTPDDVCGVGVCQGSGVLGCDDGNPCTNNACDPAIGCTTENNFLLCEDGNVCTIGDLCLDGVCVSGTGGIICNDGNLCTDDVCDPIEGCVYTPNLAGCDDGDLCTEGDICTDGSCVSGSPVDCDDGVFCNGVETCHVLLGCEDGPDPVADDGIDCTDPSCDEDNDIIVHTADDSKCPAPGACETVACDVGSGCVVTTLSDCCGNGVLEGTEECDDGNGVDEDDCSNACIVGVTVDVLFTHCGATGANGPSQLQCDNTYSSTLLAGDVTVSGGIQYWDVPASGTYRITVRGAEGGAHNHGHGGYGAEVVGDLVLSYGTTLKILVGQRGQDGSSYDNSAGGGTFVAQADNTPLIVAGGGGTRGNCCGGLGDGHGRAATGSGDGGGGSNEGGWCGCGGSGSAGGGFYTDGGPNGSGQAFIFGGTGGTGTRPGQCVGVGAGGFGGGGNSGNGGGGGGGYQGGDGGGGADYSDCPGRGGFSYNSGASPSGTDGVNLGNGTVRIIRL